MGPKIVASAEYVVGNLMCVVRIDAIDDDEGDDVHAMIDRVYQRNSVVITGLEANQDLAYMKDTAKKLYDDLGKVFLYKVRVEVLKLSIGPENSKVPSRSFSIGEL